MMTTMLQSNRLFSIPGHASFMSPPLQLPHWSLLSHAMTANQIPTTCNCSCTIVVIVITIWPPLFAPQAITFPTQFTTTPLIFYIFFSTFIHNTTINIFLKNGSLCFHKHNFIFDLLWSIIII
jgi:hypothetical protein